MPRITSSVELTVVCLVFFVVVKSFKWMIKNRKSEVLLAAEPVDSSISIPALPDFNIASTYPRPYRPWSSGKFAMTMGIQKVRHEDWIMLDNRYFDEQILRRDLLMNHREAVMQILPGSEVACVETLDLIVSFLTKRYPRYFYRPIGKPDYLHNGLTHLTFKITSPYEIPPLAIAAQLVMEDLNLLIQGFGDDPEQHYLVASFSMAPAGWYLQERMGWPLYKIHTPVPMWEDKLRKSVEKYFLKMRPDEPVSRHNFFIQTNDILFQQEPFLAGLPEPPKIDDVRIRHERQTLRRLPKSRAILFTVRTFLTPLTDLRDEPQSVKELLGAVRAMPPSIAKYKARQVWGDVVERWCEGIINEHPNWRVEAEMSE